ncbi:hypothetical protein HK100_006744, partial [Physocladia obscura]
KNLERVHYIAWLVWIKVSTPIGLLSSLIALLLMLRVVRSVQDDDDMLHRETTLHIISAATLTISAVLAFVLSKLCMFAKELWIVVRIYRRVPDIENVLGYLPEQEDEEDEEEIGEAFEGFEERFQQQQQYAEDDAEFFQRWLTKL